MNLRLKLLITVLGLQAAWILGTTVMQERVLRVGTVVLLETRPVDPRDLLRGDYLVLGYKIGDVPKERFSPKVTGILPAGSEVCGAGTEGGVLRGGRGVDGVHGTGKGPGGGEGAGVVAME